MLISQRRRLAAVLCILACLPSFLGPGSLLGAVWLLATGAFFGIFVLLATLVRLYHQRAPADHFEQGPCIEAN